MAELMFGLGQTKKKKETEAKIVQNKKDQQHYQGRPDEDVEAVQRKEHFHRDQGYKETQRDTKTNLRDIKITETVESGVRKEQFSRDKDYKKTQTETKTNLRDVNMAVETVEGEVRKEQHGREKEWKEKGKEQKEKNSSFDMAKALFN